MINKETEAWRTSSIAKSFREKRPETTNELNFRWFTIFMERRLQIFLPSPYTIAEKLNSTYRYSLGRMPPVTALTHLQTRDLRNQ